MLNKFTNLQAAVMALVTASPAYASSVIRLPEPGTISLVSLALAGIIIGRRMSSRRPPAE